jgi:hypothetical protein
MDLAVERADLYCLARVAGLAVLLQLAEEVELADLQRLAKGAGWAGSNALRGRLDWMASQWWLSSWLGRAKLSNLHTISLRGYSTEYLLHARAKHTHHHLLEHAQESPMMFTQYVFRSIPKRLHAFFFLLKGCGVSLT